MELRVEGAIVIVFCPTRTVVRIGRNEKADLTIPDSFVSGIHCQLSCLDNGDWILTDGDLTKNRPSTHGTFLNGIKLDSDEGVAVKHKDVIAIGKTQITVWEEEDRTKANESQTYY